MNEEPYVPTEVVEPRLNRIRRASWGAIFAGAFVSIVIQIMFMLLGAAIGFATLGSAQQSSPGRTLSTGSGIWLLVTGLVSTWIGACVAGRLSGGPRPADGMVHGVVTWSVSAVAMFIFLATTAGAVLTGTGTLLGGALGLGPVVQAELGQPTQNNTVAGAENSMKQLFSQGRAPLSPTGRSDASDTGQTATAGAAGVSFWPFIALLLGFFVSAWGGWTGTASLGENRTTVVAA